MGYKNKHKKENRPFILSRVKDITTLVVGSAYHLRKHLSREGNVIKDEVHDIVLKEVLEGNLVSEEGNSFSSSEYEIFIRKS